MSDWGYVAFGFIVTTLVIATYWIWVALRSRRAAQDLARIEADA